MNASTSSTTHAFRATDLSSVPRSLKPDHRSGRSGSARARSSHRDCNLCGLKFSPHNRFERFCTRCKEESPLYHFADWMIAS